jgi:hypothetical protein
MNNEEHRLENLEPEPELGEPRLEILEAWAYFENHEAEPEPKFRTPSLSLNWNIDLNIIKQKNSEITFIIKIIKILKNQNNNGIQRGLKPKTNIWKIYFNLNNYWMSLNT